MSNEMHPVRWLQQCSRCNGWFIGEALTRAVMYEQTYNGVTVRHHGWVKERVMCQECQAPRRKKVEMEL